jgi:hypothetical protein
MRLEEDLNIGSAGIVGRKKLFKSHILFQLILFITFGG